MSLETWEHPSQLYLARAGEVVEHRPLFTGDVFHDVSIPGVQDTGPAMIVAHPCAMRGRNAKLHDTLLVAAVELFDPIPADKWQNGFYSRMPLPDLTREGGDFNVALVEQVGRARTECVADSTRLACLAPFGVNLLQQRMIWNMTRLEVPTSTLWDAFAHTYEEADLLEEWLEEVDPHHRAIEAKRFEDWIRAGVPSSRQKRLRDPQQRPSVRAELREAIRARTA